MFRVHISHHYVKCTLLYALMLASDRICGDAGYNIGLYEITYMLLCSYYMRTLELANGPDDQGRAPYT